ncbi:hypothetical protein A2783_05165 [Microgenomates group bacterium RIFCSPHIGHO2_01_FULL_45_11]|nr:MAG: hypothetical protein A2783_05165 [Microgenomates group bacterium RIFCSPHIGHO2_01_FULL_45_11]
METPTTVPPATEPIKSATPTKKQSSSKPWLLTLLVVTVAVALGAAAYLFSQNQKLQRQLSTQPVSSPAQTTPTPDPTANWKTVQNEQVGISFKYPDVLFPYTNNPQIAPDYSYYGFDAFNTEAKRDHRALTETDLEFELVVYKPFKDTIEPYLSAIEAEDNTVVTRPFPGITGSYNKVKTIIDKTTLKAIFYAEQDNEYSQYDGIVVEGKNVATIRLMTGSRNKRQELLPLIDQILSTFKFLDSKVTGTKLSTPTKSPSPQIQTWNTFTNQENSLSFTYPPYTTATQVHSKYINLIGTQASKSIVMPIFISENPSGLSLIDFYLDYMGAGTTKDELLKYLYIQENVPIGNRTGIKVVQDGNFFSQQSTPFTTYLVATSNGSVVQIKTGENKGSFDGTKTSISYTDSNVKDYQQILSTFKFTN